MKIPSTSSAARQGSHHELAGQSRGQKSGEALPQRRFVRTLNLTPATPSENSLHFLRAALRSRRCRCGCCLEHSHCYGVQRTPLRINQSDHKFLQRDLSHKERNDPGDRLINENIDGRPRARRPIASTWTMSWIGLC